MKITLAGGGNMGKTYASAFIANHLISADELYLLEHLEEKAAELRAAGFSKVFHQANAEVLDTDLLIIAVKPQDAEALYRNILPYLKPQQLVLSIMAGVKTEVIAKALNTDKVLRAMPNLPAQIGMGITGFTGTAAITRSELLNVQNLLNATGKSIYFDDESMLDAVTAVSGSGPAYVFYFMDSMMYSAMSMGFTRQQAELLVQQTFMGAVHLLGNNKISASEWIARVASKGGTTEAALKVFDETKVCESIHDAQMAALNRAKELGS